MLQYTVTAAMKIKVEILSSLGGQAANAIGKGVRSIMIRSNQLHHKIKQIGVQPPQVVIVTGTVLIKILQCKETLEC